MGLKDAKAREYLSDNERFADVFNFYLFNGRQVIKADDLEERDTASVLNLYGLDGKEIAKQRWRDILKSAIIKKTDTCVFVLLGVENQGSVHYAMPVRNLIYDAMEYGSQVSEAGARHRRVRDYGDPAEFLSGFKRDDKLTPVITLTIYWGPDKWDGPRSLHDMFGEEYADILPFIDDYHLHLVVPEEIEDFELFKTSLRDVLEFIKASGDEDSIGKLLKSRDSFKWLRNEDVSAIETFTGKTFSKDNDKEGAMDMCKAWEDRLKHGEMLRLIKIVCKKLIKGMSAEDIADILEEDISLITKIADAAKPFAPEYNAEDVYTDLRPQL